MINKNKIEFKPDWITKNKIEYSKSFFEILKFYLFETPCPNVSSRGVDLEEIGWDNNSLGELYKYMLLSEAFIENINYFKFNSTAGTLKKIKENNTNKTKRENLIIMHKTEKEFYNLMYYIRCAFAHGRFSTIGNNLSKIYFFENIKQNSDLSMQCKAKIIIRESTLINWKKLICAGKDEFDKKIDGIKKMCQKRIIDYINRNRKINIKEEDIEKMFTNANILLKKYFKDVWKEVKNNKTVKYDRKNKTWILNN